MVKNKEGAIRKNKKKENFLLDNYKKSWNYIKELKIFIFVIILIFLASLVLGYFYHSEEISLIILKYLEEVLNVSQGFNFLQMTSFIFWNNLQVGFMGILFGVFLGIPSALFTLFNGYVVGFVSSLAVSSSGASSLMGLLPHGIFELPAIFFSFAMGVKLGSFVFYRDKMNKFVYFFKESLRVFLFVVLPLLIVAAIVESFLIFNLK